MKHLKAINKYFWKYRFRLGLGVLFVFLSNYFNVLTPQITGFVIDVKCATGLDVKDREHPVSCALMPNCAASGFAVVAKDTLYKLDENGNKLALAIIKETKTKKGLAVSIVGTLKDGILYVDTMSEVTEK